MVSRDGHILKWCHATLNQQLLAFFLSGPGTAGGFGGGGGNRLSSWVAEGEEDVFGAGGLFTIEFLDGRAESVEAEVGFAFGAVNAVEERGEVDKFRARLDKIKVQYLLACHKMPVAATILAYGAVSNWTRRQAASFKS